MEVVDASEIFKISRQWKYERLIYDTFKTYASQTGWKATINSSYIKYPCYKNRSLMRNFITMEAQFIKVVNVRSK